jgi:hypothetical protein
MYVCPLGGLGYQNIGARTGKEEERGLDLYIWKHPLE